MGHARLRTRRDLPVPSRSTPPRRSPSESRVGPEPSMPRSTATSASPSPDRLSSFAGVV
ncbi:hypothetical protein UO65_2006 [Actinokineospora spheciospongiae]|uniref:Uncharacterized protein n=1 Tax=Actinokineospora spheciospongiae TaxID=909613 RepID=W7J9H3_9PSEU|nr:hypothetical protein UO65_2006 [Actinokineospora spheciospongiae]